MFEPEKKHPVSPISVVRESASVFAGPGYFVKGCFFIVALVAGLVGFQYSALCGENQAVVFERSGLTIVTTENRHHFRIEVAKTRAAHMRGLMERRHMDDDAGMLFDYAKPKPIRMWMKNTFIPLDMLFIDKFGKIVGIAVNTTPFSTDVIASPGPVLAVLELNAGIVSRLRIKIGDIVMHDIFSTY